jgi:hypothetical protein
MKTCYSIRVTQEDMDNIGKHVGELCSDYNKTIEWLVKNSSTSVN